MTLLKQYNKWPNNREALTPQMRVLFGVLDELNGRKGFHVEDLDDDIQEDFMEGLLKSIMDELQQ